MDSPFEKLFPSYGASVPRETDRDCDEEEIYARLDNIPLDKPVRLQPEGLFFECRWR